MWVAEEDNISTTTAMTTTMIMMIHDDDDEHDTITLHIVDTINVDTLTTCHNEDTEINEILVWTSIRTKETGR